EEEEGDEAQHDRHEDGDDADEIAAREAPQRERTAAHAAPRRALRGDDLGGAHASTCLLFSTYCTGMTMAVTTRKSTTLPAVDSPKKPEWDGSQMTGAQTSGGKPGTAS